MWDFSDNQKTTNNDIIIEQNQFAYKSRNVLKFTKNILGLQRGEDVYLEVLGSALIFYVKRNVTVSALSNVILTEQTNFSIPVQNLKFFQNKDILEVEYYVTNKKVTAEF